MSETKYMWQVWRVSGDPEKILWATKGDAERWAREIFPTEEASKRYARIRYDNVESYMTDHELELKKEA